MDEYNSNNEARFGTGLKVMCKIKTVSINIEKVKNLYKLWIFINWTNCTESLEVGSMLSKMGKQPEKFECNQEQQDRTMCKHFW